MEYQKRRFWKYRLYKDESYETGIKIDTPIITKFFEMTVDGRITGKKGYTWDGASGPTFDTKNTFTASLFHDIIYQMIREGYLDMKWRKRGDEILYEILRSRKMTKIRAKTWYRAVRKLAGKSARYDVLTAP
jgi:hypothetical protein